MVVVTASAFTGKSMGRWSMMSMTFNPGNIGFFLQALLILMGFVVGAGIFFAAVLGEGLVGLICRVIAAGAALFVIAVSTDVVHVDMATKFW